MNQQNQLPEDVGSGLKQSENPETNDGARFEGGLLIVTKDMLIAGGVQLENQDAQVKVVVAIRGRGQREFVCPISPADNTTYPDNTYPDNTYFVGHAFPGIARQLQEAGGYITLVNPKTNQVIAKIQITAGSQKLPELHPGLLKALLNMARQFGDIVQATIITKFGK